MLFMPLTFPSGSANGVEMCATVTVNSDDFVELEEYFSLILNLESAEKSLRLGNNVSAVTLTDSDCTYIMLK